MVTMSDQPTERLSLRTVAFQDQEQRVIRTQAEAEARKNAELKRAEFEMKVAVTGHLTGKLPREGMAEVFFAGARRIAMDLLLGNVPIRNGTEAANAIQALVTAGRQEVGQSTGPGDLATPPATREEAEERIRALTAQVAQRRADASGE